MKFGTIFAAAAALAIIPAAAQAQDVGAIISGNDGNPIGAVIANDGTNITVDTGKHQVPLPGNAFASGENGFSLNITKEQLDAMMDEQVAAAAAALDAALVPDAAVISADAQPLGSVEEIDGDNVVIADGDAKVTLPKNLLAVDANGQIMALANKADIDAAMAAQ